MARPCKMRRVCSMPGCWRFGPREERETETVVMTVDEFSAIRLIDLQGLKQEQCAACMNIARTTVQAIYTEARRKIAKCLVEGCELVIEGGDFVLCAEGSGACENGCHCHYQNAHREEKPE